MAMLAAPYELMVVGPDVEAGGGCVAVMQAMMSIRMLMAVAPPMKAVLRPMRSMTKTWPEGGCVCELSFENSGAEGGFFWATGMFCDGWTDTLTTKVKTETTLISPKKPVIRRFELPAPTALKICGAYYRNF